MIDISKDKPAKVAQLKIQYIMFTAIVLAFTFLFGGMINASYPKKYHIAQMFQPGTNQRFYTIQRCYIFTGCEQTAFRWRIEETDALDEAHRELVLLQHPESIVEKVIE